MTVLITGICGFVGSVLAEHFVEQGHAVCGIDSLMRPGSETNRAKLRKLGVTFIHGDIRSASDFEQLPAADWVIDAAANPSVLAGLKAGFSSRQLFEHNLASLVNVLEYCKTRRAGFLLLSSSRVYSIPALAKLPRGNGDKGIGADFSTAAPVSLYGSLKLASEAIALEYGEAFDFPVWIDRCGVLAGAGQFGTPDQGIFSYWINAHLRRRPLRYIGFEGTGRQARDAFHPRDLAALLDRQINTNRKGGQRIYTAGGGPENTISLAGLTAWCDKRFGEHKVQVDTAPRPYDVPWVAMDNADAARDFEWRISIPITAILEQIAIHAEQNPTWLEISGL